MTYFIAVTTQPRSSATNVIMCVVTFCSHARGHKGLVSLLGGTSSRLAQTLSVIEARFTGMLVPWGSGTSVKYNSHTKL
jgi:hypothetical protein